MAASPLNFPKYEYMRDSRNISLADIVPADMLHMIDSYWYQWPPVEPFWFGMIGFVIAILGVVSITGNFMVLYIFTTTKTLRTPSNMYVVNLAFSDFMMMFCMFPPVVANSIYGTWRFGPFLCELYALLGSLFGCVSIWSMTLIARDRYNVIVQGMARKPLTIGRAMLWIILVWVVCAVWAIFPLFGWNRYVPEGNLTACGTDYFVTDMWNKSYLLVYGSWCYILPLGIIVNSYYYILKAVSEHERAMREQAKKMNVASLRQNDGDKEKSVEIKLAKVALVTISLWFMAWTPYTIINLTGIYGIFNLSPLGTITGSVFAKANAVYNPIVYGLSHPKYQLVLQEKFPRLACVKVAADNNDSKSQATGEVAESAA